MRSRLRLTAASILAFVSPAYAVDATTLWYEQPATDWEKEALPLGNGRIGAMVFGGVVTKVHGEKGRPVNIHAHGRGRLRKLGVNLPP